MARQTPSTLEPTANRTRLTTDVQGIVPLEIDYDAPGKCAQSMGAVPVFRWKAGAELPPFVPTNPFATSTLLALVNGTIDIVPSVAVSQAVAVQIWCLLFARGDHHHCVPTRPLPGRFEQK